MTPRWLRPAAGEVDPALIAEVRARPLVYPLGSGQAEEVALLSGIKPMIRQMLDAGQAERRSEHFVQRRMAVAQLPRGGQRLLLVAREPEQLQQALDCELAVTRGQATMETHRRMGRLLGFPRCCVEAFCDPQITERPNEVLLRRAAERTEGAGLPWLNVLDLHVFHLLPWYPCSFGCRYAAAYTGRLEELLARHFRSFFRQMRASLACPRIYLSDDVQLRVEGEVRGGALWPRMVLPTSRDRHPDAALGADDELACARALAEVRAASRVEARGQALWLDGEPWAEGFFVPFAG